MGLKFWLILILYSLHVATVTGARSGPYKASYAKVEECKHPTLPLDKNPGVLLIFDLYNTSTDTNLMRGKVTVVRDHVMKKVRARAYFWTNNKSWKMMYTINNVACHRAFFPLLVMATGVKYDLKTCKIFKGVYEFNDLSADKIQHIVWMNAQEYGRTLWKIEMLSFTTTVFCWNFETIVEPADKIKH